MASDCKMIDELWIGKDLEANGHGLTKVLS
jgi:hypothetical protein